MNALICQAIRRRRILEFDYRGYHRIVAPYCHGVSTNGSEVLRGIQVAGGSSSGGLAFGKLWIVEKISGLRMGDRSFSPDDPNYNPNDSAMARIHCSV